MSFNYILGVTGTLDTLSKEQHKIMKETYNIPSMTFAPSVYDIPPHLKTEEDKIEGLKEEILIINEEQEAYHSGKTSDDKIEIVNEMAAIIEESKETWFRKIVERIEIGI
jgi:hypothetical protein